MPRANSESSPEVLKVLLVYGTRPEIIKLAPVARALAERPERFAVSLCATAQQRELTDQFQEVFGLLPDYDLDLMRPDQGLNDLSSRALAALDEMLLEARPDWVLVQGDTTTAMATALAAFHLGLRVGHVEAGLRTGDLTAPFPEEANRRLIDVVANALFAPTARAQRALLNEGHDPARVFLTGNTVIDALQWISASLPQEPAADEVLVTVHRRESFGAPLREILGALQELAQRFPDIDWILPVHRNPHVAGPVRELLSDAQNIVLHDPFPYADLVRQMRRCRLVLTDSGGIQEEAPTFGKPVLVLREKTERPEGIEAGVARLVGTTRSTIVEQTALLLTDDAAYGAMARTSNPYGDGRAAERIAALLAGEEPELLDVDQSIQASE